MKGLLSLFIIMTAILLTVAVDTASATTQSALVPEPATWLLLGSGLAGLAAYKWYRSR